MSKIFGLINAPLHNLSHDSRLDTKSTQSTVSYGLVLDTIHCIHGSVLDIRYHSITESQSSTVLFRGVLLGHGERFSNLLRSTVFDLDVLDRFVPTVSLVLLYLPDYIHSLHHLPEHHVSPIQPGGLLHGDEELRTISVLSSVSHGEPPSSIMLQLEVLDNPVELAPLVSLTLGLLRQLHEVLHSLRHSFPKQSNLDPSNGFSSYRDVKPHFVSHLGSFLPLSTTPLSQ